MAKTKGIYKRGNVYWIRYAGLDGRTVFESSRSDKFRDAENLLIQRRQLIKEGKQPEIKRITNHTFNELAEQYLQWATRQRSHAQKAINCKQLQTRFGNIPLRRFNTMMLEQYQTERLEKGNKPATVNRHLALIKHMFTKAVDWDMVEEETLKRVRKVKLLEENNRRLRYLSREECQLLIQECERLGKKKAQYKHLAPMVIMALNTGMRRSEILNLRWDNVDLKNGFILLDKTKNGDRREIPTNDTLRATLKGLPRRLDGGPVFFDPTTNNGFKSITRSFTRACRNIEIRDFTFHDLRHTFASHLVVAGVDIATVKELLGHKTLTMTMRYAHLAPSHKVKAVDVLDGVINEKQAQEI